MELLGMLSKGSDLLKMAQNFKQTSDTLTKFMPDMGSLTKTLGNTFKSIKGVKTNKFISNLKNTMSKQIKSVYSNVTNLKNSFINTNTSNTVDQRNIRNTRNIKINRRLNNKILSKKVINTKQINRKFQKNNQIDINEINDTSQIIDIENRQNVQNDDEDKQVIFDQNEFDRLKKTDRQWTCEHYNKFCNN